MSCAAREEHRPFGLIPSRTEKQSSQQEAQNKPNDPGNDEMGGRDVFSAFTASAFPLPGRDECLDGFEAGTGIHENMYS